MARRVFFSFHYENDVSRSMVVRHSWVTQGKEAAGFVDKAEFEQVKKQGKKAVCDWIDKQLKGTSVTVVLIGSETLDRDFVKYEIMKSLERGNAIIGVYIHKIRALEQSISKKGQKHTLIGYDNNKPIYFDDICYSFHDYVDDYGFKNMGSWIEEAAINN